MLKRAVWSVFLAVALVTVLSAGAEETAKLERLHVALLSEPQRMLETRTTGAPFADGDVRAFKVNVPDEARALLVNLVAVDAEARGHLLFWSGTGAPHASSINFTAHEDVANEITVRINRTAAGDFVSIKARVDGVDKRVHVVADIVGYLVQ